MPGYRRPLFFFIMEYRSSIEVLRQLDINYILYVTKANDSKCEQAISEDWLRGYHQAVKDVSLLLRNDES